jgi:hypothetical protein
MNYLSRNNLVLLTLIIIGVITHLAPHDLGVSTVGALSMLAAAYLPRHLLLVPVLVTVIVGDLVNGTYALMAMMFVYLAHLAAAMAVTPTLSRVSSPRVTTAAVLNAVIFYLISNLTPMAMLYYPTTLDGLMTCYINGLPFLAKGILANIIFGSIGFGIVNLWGKRYENRISST